MPNHPLLRLPSWHKDELTVVIETPKGTRNKLAFDEKLEVFQLKKVLPAGMSFPYDFGFVPQTRADDGDPIDVLVLMDAPAFPGCVVMCRLIGIIEGEQLEPPKRTPVRNDRLIAAEVNAASTRRVRNVKDLGTNFVSELEAFFVNYHQLSKHQYRVLATRGPRAARAQVNKARTGGT
jgi:inorganic pyrophosphatase